ncbi:hypothetical protein [Spirulina subsalsa]|uniref:hypothetical protein n=1 Tax=Spirulina subsalsa TaxID=54311 RepID=UPI0003161F95|nr:hypothetical protein [Spirulina subsalsa]
MFARLPTRSLFLLWLIYSVFGWLLRRMTPQWQHWALAASLIVLMALMFTAPSSIVRKFFNHLLESDSRAFLSIALLAFIAVLILTWISHFIQIILLVAALALARLELQGLGYKEWPCFLILVLICLGGFALGLGAHHWYLGFAE